GVCELLGISGVWEEPCAAMLKKWQKGSSRSYHLEISVRLKPSKPNSKRIFVEVTCRGRKGHKLSASSTSFDPSSLGELRLLEIQPPNFSVERTGRSRIRLRSLSSSPSISMTQT